VLSAALPRGASVFVVGEEGVIQALRDKAFVVITDPADKRAVQAVVGGFDRQFSYDKMLRAAAHIRAGAAFYGTNADATFPTSEGLVPGAGAVLAAIMTAAEKQPIVVGKPSPFLFELAAQRMNLTPPEILVVGDRLETDIAGGQAFGARTALVLSGVSTREGAADWHPAPDLIAADLAQLVGA
jgi:4-nitrophenyl phosphatase